jgi:hypothetical protein
MMILYLHVGRVMEEQIGGSVLNRHSETKVQGSEPNGDELQPHQ